MLSKIIIIERYANIKILIVFILINETHNINPKTLENIDQKSHTPQEFSFNVTQTYLQNYNFECSLQNCSICNL